MNKNVNALYFSATGVVGKVVKEIAKGLSEDFNEYNITLPKSRDKNLIFNEKDIVVVGAPVYAGRLPKLVADYFEKNIKGDNTFVVLVAVYGNRAYEDALVELKDIFEERGFIPVAAASFIGEHSYTSKVATGRPDEMDLNIARDFSVKIKEKVSKVKDINDIEYLFVQGNVPYQERKEFPESSPDTDENCIKCGICAKFCPTSAISFEDYITIDSKKCLACCSCIKRCPVDSKSMNSEFYFMIRDKLLANVRDNRKEPELFI